MEWFRKFVDWVGKLPEKWKSSSKTQKLITIMILSSIVLAIILTAILNAPRYQLLLIARDEKDAGAIINQLETLGITYKVEAGNKILIPTTYNVYEVRMRLASSGTLSGSTRGFEILDQNTLGATSFDKQVKYQIALQGELERTISTINGVESARVVLTLPKYTYYVRGEMNEPRASVMVSIRPGVTLSKEQVMGIISLVQGAVEGLKPENIKVISQNGIVLSDQLNLDQSTALASTKLELKMNLENYYKKKIQNALENVFGMGRVEVIPDVKLNWEKIEKKITTYAAPNKKEGLVRSKETLSELSTTKTGAEGPVGTESNIPPTTYESPESTGQTTYQKSQEVVNYELNETIENIIDNKEGEIENITISVIVDASSTVIDKVGIEQAKAYVQDIIDKSIKANSTSTENDLTYAIAFVPFSRELEEQFYKEITTQRELEKFRIRIILLFLFAIIMFFATYLGLIQFKKFKARKLMLERYKRLQQEAEQVLTEMAPEEAVPGTEVEALLEQLKIYLNQTADARPEDVASVIKVWISEKI